MADTTDAATPAAKSALDVPAMPRPGLVKLSRDAIKGANDEKIERVDVEEWGGYVFVKRLTGRERDFLEQSTIAGRTGNQRVNLLNLRAKTLVAAVVEEDGDPMFTMQDVEWLTEKAAVALQKVYDKAAEMAGITKQDEEDLTKNSSAARSGNSTSSLRSH